MLVSVLLVSSIAVSVYFGSLKPKATRATGISDLLAFSIELNKTEFVRGENVTVSLSLTNKSNKTITVLWGSYYVEWGQRIYFDYYIIDANGAHIYQYSYHSWRLAATTERVLKPSDQVVNFYHWYQIYVDSSGHDAIVPKGTYSVVGCTRWMILTVDGQATGVNLGTPAISFTVERLSTL